MHKFKVHFIDDTSLEIHFDAGGTLWQKFLTNLRVGVLEVLYCSRVKEYIKVNWNNVKYIEPVTVVKLKETKKNGK